jgi:hypothetical protein
VVQTSKQLNVAGTGWVVQLRGMACGYGIGAGTDIVALDKDTSRVKTLAQGDDVVNASLRNDPDGNLVIVVPNRSDLTMHPENLPEHVVFQFTPKDDPEDRRKYYLWNRDRSNERNRAWYCSNVLPGMSEPNRRTMDEVLGHTVYKPFGSRRSYCNDGSS